MAGQKEHREQKEDNYRAARKQDGAEGEAMSRPGTMRYGGEVTANDPGIARDGFIGLVDGIASNDQGVAANPRLGIDDGISTDNRCPAYNAAGNVEVAEENEDAAGDFSFDLNRAEDTGCVMDLLPLGDEDVLVEIGTRAMTLRL